MSTKRSSLPIANPVGESLDLMKKMWGFAGLPGLPTPGSLTSMAARIPQLPSMLAPTLDVDELEKRITDLRAVEQWLELNATILRTTIQSLEVQCATITTLKGISGAMVGPIFSRSSDLSQSPPEVKLGLDAMRAEESKAAAHGRAPMEDSAPKAKPTAAKKSSASATPVAAMDPAAWWNTLQDQFARIASAAGQSVVAPTPAKQRKTATKRRVAKARG